MKFKEHKKAIGIGIASLLLVAVIGISAAKAQGGSFLQIAAKAFGESLAKMVEIPADFLKGAFEPFAGAEGDTFSSAKKAYGILSPDSNNTISSTSVALSLLNSSGVERIIKGCGAYFEGTSAWGGEFAEQAAGGVVMDFSTSSSATASSTAPVWSVAFVSSTSIVSFNTSTLHGANNGANTNGWKRKWANGEYLNLKFSSSVSTTEAYAGCEYELFN